MYATESSQSGAVARALQDADFPAALETALRTRALPRTTDTPPVAQATVMVIGWGVVSTSGAAAGRHCFVAVVTLSVAKGSEKRYEESLRLAPGGGSEGAPPAQCASLGRFAENQGQLARESARDYAEILAVMVLDRLARLE
jgi:hypothetical protein